CCAAPALAGAVLDVTHGRVVLQVAEQLRPALVLFPAGAVGPELAPPLAVRLDASYQPRASLEVIELPSEGEARGRRCLRVRRLRPGGREPRPLDVADGRRTVVAPLPAGRPARSLGEPLAEVEMLSDTRPGRPAPVELSSDPDPEADLELAD